jgi:hypothetical protein
MRKILSLGKGIGYCICAVIFGGLGLLAFFLVALSKSGSDASLVDPEFIFVYVVFGGLVFVGIRGAYRIVRRETELTIKEMDTGISQPVVAQPTPAAWQTTEDKLAHLIKKPNDGGSKP